MKPRNLSKGLFLTTSKVFEKWKPKPLKVSNKYLNDNEFILQTEFADGELLRFLQVGRFDFNNTHKYIEKYTDWQKEHIPPVLSDLSEKIIRSGFMYIHGRDKHFRPLVVLNPTALIQFKTYNTDVIGNEVIK